MSLNRKSQNARKSLLSHTLKIRKRHNNEGAESWLWHRRFRHCNFHGLKILQQKNMMRDLLTIKEINDVCEGCLLGKQHRQLFPIGKAWRAKELLELVHTDVCGPMHTPSHD